MGLLEIILVSFVKMCNVCPANMKFGRHLLLPLAVANVNICFVANQRNLVRLIYYDKI